MPPKSTPTTNGGIVSFVHAPVILFFRFCSQYLFRVAPRALQDCNVGSPARHEVFPLEGGARLFGGWLWAVSVPRQTEQAASQARQIRPALQRAIRVVLQLVCSIFSFSPANFWLECPAQSRRACSDFQPGGIVITIPGRRNISELRTQHPARAYDLRGSSQIKTHRIMRANAILCPSKFRNKG